MVEFWEAEQELEFDVHDMILSKNASEKTKLHITNVVKMIELLTPLRIPTFFYHKYQKS